MLLSGNPSLAEARILHPGNAGYIFVCAKDATCARGWRQRSVPMHALEEAVHAVSLAPNDRYLSQASFIARSRYSINVQSIRAAFVDLDCLQKYGLQPDASFVERVLALAEEMGVPTPSVVICSGRGLYCKWYFKDEVSAGELVRWKGLNQALLTIFASLGVDSNVRDVSRVLRVIGSTNTRVADGHDSSVRVVEDSGELHDFDTLCTAVAAALERYQLSAERDTALSGFLAGDASARISRASRRVLKNLSDLAGSAETNLGGLIAFGEARKPIMVADGVGAKLAGSKNSRGLSHYELQVGLNWRRFIDMRNLIMMRGGAPEGTRDVFIFWMLNHLALSGVVTPQNFNEEAKGLIRLFPRHDGFDPLGEGHLDTLINRVKAASEGATVEFAGRRHSALYTPRTAELVEILQVSEEEQMQMSTLFLAPEKRRRQDVKNPARADNRVKRRQTVQVIRALPSESAAVAAEQVELSERQVRRIRARYSLAQEITGLRRQGASIDEVATQLAITQRQVKSLLKLSASEAKQGNTPLGKRQNSNVIRAAELRAAGHKMEAIADAMGTSKRQVRRWLQIHEQDSPKGSPLREAQGSVDGTVSGSGGASPAACIATVRGSPEVSAFGGAASARFGPTACLKAPGPSSPPEPLEPAANPIEFFLGLEFVEEEQWEEVPADGVPTPVALQLAGTSRPMKSVPPAAPGIGAAQSEVARSRPPREPAFPSIRQPGASYDHRNPSFDTRPPIEAGDAASASAGGSEEFDTPRRD